MDRFDIKAMFSALKEKIPKNKRVIIIVAVCIAAMAAIMLSEFCEPKTEPKFQSEDIEAQTKNQLVKILENINGAGRVEVMLTFESSQEKIYAYDTDENIDSEKEKGEERKTKSEHIIIKNENGEDGLKVKDIYPQIRGVAVVCDGGDDPIIKGQIISMISALFNINSTKISVAKMAY